MCLEENIKQRQQHGRQEQDVRVQEYPDTQTKHANCRVPQGWGCRAAGVGQDLPSHCMAPS